MRHVLLEACVASANEALAAVEVGADRVELNRAPERDGLTPSVAEVSAAVSEVSAPVIAMLRPHDRGFVYSATEFAGMTSDLDELLEAGAAGVAFGALTAQKTVDSMKMSQLVRAAGDRSVVFHRAFDAVPDPFTALEQLIDLGVTRILTSGQARTAVEGIGVLIELIEQASGRIEILPGAGVSPSNALELADRTGCDQLHGSFRGPDGRFDPSLLGETRRAVDRWSQAGS